VVKGKEQGICFTTVGIVFVFSP